jgi:glycine/D-amino acid oxidase-like deaminating enzyme
VDGLFQALGGGGVGVQISPAIGAMVADLITTGNTSVVPGWSRYRLDRFGARAASAATNTT